MSRAGHCWVGCAHRLLMGMRQGLVQGRLPGGVGLFLALEPFQVLFLDLTLDHQGKTVIQTGEWGQEGGGTADRLASCQCRCCSEAMEQLRFSQFSRHSRTREAFCTHT